jgi:hypothetical protein
MSFETVKEKEATSIHLINREMKNYFVFILFLILQMGVLGILSLYTRQFDTFFAFLAILSAGFILIFLTLILVQKSLRLCKEELTIEYRIFGLLLYRIRMQWTKIAKIAVEFTRLKVHDILFELDKKTIYLGTSLNEEESDSLLKEIQLFHHYYVSN